MNAVSPLLLALSLLFPAACTRRAEPAPARPVAGVASHAPALWEPADPRFTGCAGG
jgi:hypothetical protein